MILLHFLYLFAGLMKMFPALYVCKQQNPQLERN
nr:MAG TPA: hypothetical protein [Caudoviricetes sp.]